MTDKEIRKLGRPELLELLIEQTRRKEELEQQVTDLQAQLKSRDIRLSQAGSIAEASLQVSRVFEEAQQAADQYLQNIQRLEREQQAATDQILGEARKQAEAIVSQAREESGAYWQEVSQKMERFYDDHKGLRELIRYMELKL